MTLASRWKEFVNSLSDKMETSDPEGAMFFREYMLQQTPPDEEMLEWGMASATFHHYGSELAFVLNKLGKRGAALLVLDTLRELNLRLMMMNVVVEVPQEFTKEVKLSRPI